MHSESFMLLQERQWELGNCPSVEDILATAEQVVCSVVLVDLLWNERRLRMENGEALPPKLFCKECVERFPEIAKDIAKQCSFVEIMEELAKSTNAESIESECLDTSAVEPLDHVDFFEAQGYEDIVCVGEGGFGRVFMAQQIQPFRSVAIKVLARGNNGESSRRKTFREAERIAQLEHPNIVPIYAVQEYNGVPFFTMQFLKEGTLLDRLDVYVGEFKKIAKLLVVIAESIAYAHSKGILHCDLKPSNVLMNGDRPLLADFGLALLSKSKENQSSSEMNDNTPLRSVLSVGGTPEYMAPEQWTTDQASLGPQTDVYGLGGILYHLLTKQPPGSRAQYGQQWKPAKPCRSIEPSIPTDLAAICDKCLATKPCERYETATAFKLDLERYLSFYPVVARGGNIWNKGIDSIAKFVKRYEAIAISILAGLVICFVTAAIIYSRGSRSLHSANIQIETAASKIAEVNTDLQALTLDAANRTRELGVEFHKDGDFAMAVRKYDDAIADYDKLLVSKPDDPVVLFHRAQASNNHGMATSQLGDHQQAEQKLVACQKDIQTIIAQGLSSDELRFLASDLLSNRGKVKRLQNRWEESVDFYNRALKTLSGPVSPEMDLQKTIRLAKMLRDLGSVLASNPAKSTEAIAILKEAQATSEKLLDLEPANQAFLLANHDAITSLADAYWNAEQRQLAMACFEKLVATWAPLLDGGELSMNAKEHYAGGANNYARYLRLDGDVNRALIIQKRSVDIFHASWLLGGLGIDSTMHYLASLENLALCYEVQAENTGAQEYFEQSNDAYTRASELISRAAETFRVRPDWIERVASIGFNHANFLAWVNQGDASREVFESAELEYKKLESPNTVMVCAYAKALNERARQAIHNKQFDQAEMHLDQSTELLGRFEENGLSNRTLSDYKTDLIWAKGTLAFDRWKAERMMPHNSIGDKQLLNTALANYSETLKRLTLPSSQIDTANLRNKQAKLLASRSSVYAYSGQLDKALADAAQFKSLVATPFLAVLLEGEIMAILGDFSAVKQKLDEVERSPNANISIIRAIIEVYLLAAEQILQDNNPAHLANVGLVESEVVRLWGVLSGIEGFANSQECNELKNSIRLRLNTHDSAFGS